MVLSVVLSLIAACGGSDPKAKPGFDIPKVATSDRAAAPPTGPDAPVSAPPVVIFTVLDTVRADHTSLCGYERPTTPTLEEMARKGASYSCRTYSPAPWTHPSHATFFTGRSVVEHHAIWVTHSDVEINQVTRVRPLEDSFVTVAERFKAAGYQTVAVSGNMIITPPSGLLQGFDHIAVADEAYALRGSKHTEKLTEVLATLDKSKPLFLFLNYYDAHDPYPNIPEGVKWAPEQPIENLHPNTHNDDEPYYQFIKGMSKGEDERQLLRRVRNGYDWGIKRADMGLGGAWELLIADGWLDKGFRTVVTADHGEFLGEHRLLRHGGFLYEPVVKVPMLYFDSTATTQPVFPEISTGMWVHDLLLFGTIPTDGPPIHAVSEPNERDVLIGSLGGVIWSGDEKVMCTDGERIRYNLTDDPGEMHRLALGHHAMNPQLRELCGKVDALYHMPAPAENPELVKALQAVGYME